MDGAISIHRDADRATARQDKRSRAMDFDVRDENCAEHTWRLGRTSAEYRQYARGLRQTVGPGDSWFGRGVANVQAVASTTERLTSSVSEIGRQVSQSTGITGRAVASGTDQIAARMFDAANEISQRSDMLRTSVEGFFAAIGTA
jgi:hypothetical protein